MGIQDLINCISGPRLFRLYKTAENASHNYSPNSIEAISDNFIKLCSISFKLITFTSPVILGYLYKKGYIGNGDATTANFDYHYVARLFFTVGVSFATAILIRGYARSQNSDYISFVKNYTKIVKMSHEEFLKHKSVLNSYDFDFNYWPVEYRSESSQLDNGNKPPQMLQRAGGETSMYFPFSLLSYVAIHTFGRRMMYPGTVGILQKIMDPMLREGRSTLVEHHKGQRYKLKTLDGNFIDSMFIDNRNQTQNGNILVVCCEGNAGFYEIGIMSTPLACGYSVLGWNHPGFGGSTGVPFPQAEVNAMDTVMKFAIERLNFIESSIVVFAWSIGGYPASWASMQYPHIKGIILDATFDDVTELAVAKMPSSWKPLVIDAVGTYFNLNVSEQLSFYNGPVHLIRRTKDEVINTDDNQPVKTNLANNILVKLFKQRFPKLLKEKAVESALISWLHKERKYYPYFCDKKAAQFALKTYFEEKGASYPVEIGDGLDFNAKLNIIFYMATKMFVDYNSTHCTNLPTDLFTLPWDVLKLAQDKSKL